MPSMPGEAGPEPPEQAEQHCAEAAANKESQKQTTIGFQCDTPAAFALFSDFWLPCTNKIEDKAVSNRQKDAEESHPPLKELRPIPIIQQQRVRCLAAHEKQAEIGIIIAIKFKIKWQQPN